MGPAANGSSAIRLVNSNTPYFYLDSNLLTRPLGPFRAFGGFRPRGPGNTILPCLGRWDSPHRSRPLEETLSPVCPTGPSTGPLPAPLSNVHGTCRRGQGMGVGSRTSELEGSPGGERRVPGRVPSAWGRVGHCEIPEGLPSSKVGLLVGTQSKNNERH